ncbi:MAG: response regulator [Gemmatimonadetes bacterium]|nr:response regulator [Gemmatimonadota bacterium]
MAAATQAGAQRRRILLVDDDPAVRVVIAQHLRRRGYEVMQAESAEEVLLRANRESYDVVVTDVHLPGLSGVDLAHLLLARSPLQPIVVITGDSDEALARAVLRNGPVGYLLKPFEFFELDAAIGQALTRLELAETTQALTRGAGLSGAAGVGGRGDRDLGGGLIAPAWLRLADERSGAGPEHGFRVAQVGGALLSALSASLPGLDRSKLEMAARAHEVGRLWGPAADRTELAEQGARFLVELGIEVEVVQAVRHMHERWDGRGGPDGLSGDAIPLLAQVLAAADAVDHLAVALADAGGDPESAPLSAVDRVRAGEGTVLGPAIAAGLAGARSAIAAIWTLARWSGSGRGTWS